MTVMTAEIPVRMPEDEPDCDSCATRLRSELAGHRGLITVESSGASGIRVAFDPDVCSLSCVTDAAQRIGADLGRRFHHEVLPVSGMDCYDCARTIERAVCRVGGVSSSSVNFPAAQMRVEYESDSEDQRLAIAQQVRKQVKTLGYRVPDLPRIDALAHIGHHDHEHHDDHDHGDASFLARHRRDALTVGSAVLLIGGLVASMVAPEWASVSLYALSIVVGGAPIAKSGFGAVVATRRPDINTLMIVAVVGATAIGAWLEGALVVVLFSIGENLEHYAVDRARRSLSSLLALAPESAVVVREGEEIEVPVGELSVDDVVVVRPGQRIPGDGTVIEGVSAVDQAAITGESIPVDKAPGDMAFAGTLNVEGRLFIRIDKAPGDTTIARIGKAIAEAQSQKAPAERWVDAFARRYTPIVMAVAALTAIGPPLLGFGSYADWIYRGLAFLILACPCALVIATPVTVVAALARASAGGVLVKGGAFLEAAATIEAVTFDKTGTLTAGRPRVTKVVPIDSRTEAQVLQLAAALEAASEHPLARAIVNETARRNLEVTQAESFISLRGSGVEGVVAGRAVRIGKPAAFVDHPEGRRLADSVAKLEREGRTVVVVGDDERIAGVIALNDVVRPGTRDALAELGALGVHHLVMLTGDHLAAGRAIGSAAGIEDVRAGMLPGEKVDSIVDIEKRYGRTAMVGDGVNDAPALARSSLGVAMGTAGSPTAIETADVALMGDDLAKLPRLIGLARWSQAVVRQNIAFSLGVKAVAAGLALLGLLTLWMAVLADVGATLLVVVNGLRLLRGRPRSGKLAGVPILDAVATSSGGPDER